MKVGIILPWFCRCPAGKEAPVCLLVRESARDAIEMMVFARESIEAARAAILPEAFTANLNAADLYLAEAAAAVKFTC
jgi:hypothetical protein